MEEQQLGNYHIHMAYDIDAEPDEVRRRLASPEGLATWWSDQVTGSMEAVGDQFYVTFPDAPKPFEFDVVSTGPDVYDWHVESSPEWWAGTTVHFEVTDSENGGTSLMFSHKDFEEGHPIVPIVTPAWAHIVSNLKAMSETGGDTAFFQTN